MTRTALAIFVKTPGLSPLKTRLAANIGQAAAEEFYHLSLQAIYETVKELDVSPYWAVAEENGTDHSLWQSFQALYTGEGNLGQRQCHIYETLLQQHDKVLLIGADAPQLSKDVIEQAMTVLDKEDFVIGPARDGGYYLFGGRVSTSPDIWIDVTWSAETTRAELESKLPSDITHLPELTDIDEKEDLNALIHEMPNKTNIEQKQLIEWIEKL